MDDAELSVLEASVIAARSAALAELDLEMDGFEAIIARAAAPQSNPRPESDGDMPFSDWLDHLPFPLASILACYDAASESREKYEYLLKFFEATSMYSAVVMLSALRADPEVYQRFKTKVVRGKPPVTSQFGGWVFYGLHLAKATRKLLASSDPSRWEALYRVSRREWVEAIASDKLFGWLQIAGDHRNKLHHGGRLPAALLSERLAELQGVLDALRGLWGTRLGSVKLLSPGGCHIGAVHHYAEARWLMGANVMQKAFPLDSRASMRSDRLYLYEEGTMAPLELLPFIWVSRDPGELHSTCYFYNRLEQRPVAPMVRWSTFHRADDFPEREADPALLNLFADWEADGA